MASAKFEVAQFDGKIDFNMWCQKMKAILMQMKCVRALDGSWPPEMTTAKKIELDETAWSTIFLYLSDNVIRTIGETKTATELWTKLTSQYMTKTIPNKCYLLKQLFSFKMDPSVDLDENLNRFTKLTQDLANCDEKLSKDQLTVVLLNSISDRYRDIKIALEYGREDLTIDIIINALRNKALEIKLEAKDNGDTLMIRGKGHSKPSYHFKGFNENKSRWGDKNKSKNAAKGKKYFHCGKLGHFIKDCYKKKNEMKERKSDDGNDALVYNNE